MKDISKPIGKSLEEFMKELKQKQIEWQKQEAEKEAQEKAAWEALSEDERRAILEKRELERQEAAVYALVDERETLIKTWKSRGITKRYYDATWENWTADTPEKQLALKTVKTAWENNLFFTGKNGTGKTHLAMCLVKEGATFSKFSDVCSEIQSDFENESETLDYYGNRKLLILDEVGRHKISEFKIDTLFEIIDRRWNNVLPTTIITNLSIEEFQEIYGMAIMDRLRPIVVNFNWESYRT